ncbi:DNA double strand break repair Rad50 ATPase, putative [Entamoeba histolytica KU27]|uniref:DNA double strand break repair Rad50 ATPase, putative n=1 Tax=Entamoeba histolytica KU27 TaxID=885311 RepID=M2RXK8_ENTHI|nr:DNA double strand break repair Rad50 ATPase, putative [Entamoeba histolytica KU27]
MKQLDTVYLMKVIPHIRDMKDIQNIELINKKCGVAINSLKVNPWFTSEKDINKFCRIFNPPTCNCNLLPVDETILMKVEKIKNYDIDNFLRTMEMFDEERMIEEGEEEIGITEKEKERIRKIIQKVETITCLSDIPEELIEILIENMQKGIKIRCGEVFSVLFERIIDKVKIKEEKYPSEIIIEGNTNGVWIRNIEKKNIRIIYDDIPEKVISNTPKGIKSTINEIDIKPKRIILKRNEEYKRMSLKEAEEICIIRMKDSTFEGLFDNCKKLYIDECENCKFIIKQNEINKMKITRCKNTEITGKLDNLEEIVTIDNEECSIPETKKNTKEDTEIIDMNNQKKDIEIETDKKHVIIRNGYDSIIKIKSDINSDVTIENSEDIIFEGEYEEYGNIQFNNCKNKEQKEYNEQEIKSRIRYAQSIIINKCENMKFDIDEVKELLEVVDSKVGIFVRPFPCDVKTDTIHIENSQLISFSSFASCNKGIIINSSGINSISYCQEEVIMKRMQDVKFMLSEKLKKLEMEECSGIDIDSDVKGKEVKMIKCQNMKIIDTSNSIQPIECDNVKVITEQQNGMGSGFGRFLASGNIAMGGFGGEFLH